MRIDKYLKLSRIIKRRTVANELCDNGKVLVNGRVVKSHYEIKIDDNIIINVGDKQLKHLVLDIPYDSKKSKTKE